MLFNIKITYFNKVRGLKRGHEDELWVHYLYKNSFLIIFEVTLK